MSPSRFYLGVIFGIVISGLTIASATFATQQKRRARREVSTAEGTA